MSELINNFSRPETSAQTAASPSELAGEAKSYWEYGLLSWEQRSYSPRGLTKWLGLRSHLRRRMDFAAFALEALHGATSVCDLGCGSGLLLRHLDSKKFPHVYGIDVASSGVTRCQKAFAPERGAFRCDDAVTCAWPAADVYVALGLVDWLNEKQLSQLLGRLAGRPFLISYSRQSSVLWSLAHQLYVRLCRRDIPSGYEIQYYSESQLRHLLPATVEPHFLTEAEFGLVGFVASFDLQKIYQKFRWS